MADSPSRSMISSANSRFRSTSSPEVLGRKIAGYACLPVRDFLIDTRVVVCQINQPQSAILRAHRPVSYPWRAADVEVLTEDEVFLYIFPPMIVRQADVG